MCRGGSGVLSGPQWDESRQTSRRKRSDRLSWRFGRDLRERQSRPKSKGVGVGTGPLLREEGDGEKRDDITIWVLFVNTTLFRTFVLTAK